ncbi:hypothetical protein [Stenotrophomonas sp. OVS01A]|uniref:hypothetical protein n=1 Tax=Stenotrophomonas sp. OVS01A TaxID=2862680 RepID=UPI001CBE0B29|nr:hypothetical protein [Stenotrophomonas sp. OVS01A]
MQTAVLFIAITGSTLSLAALVHLQLASWLFPDWVRSLYTPGGRYRTVGIVLQVLAWIAAAAITGAGVAFMLSWMPNSWGSADELGDFTAYAQDLAWLAGLFMGSGWVWALLQVGRRQAQ